MSERISVVLADELILKQVETAPAVRVPLAKAAGRILREDVKADRDLPPFDRCMMDGYAVRAADAVPNAAFSVTGRSFAGSEKLKLDSAPSSAIEVMTGSVLPEGADAVIRYEDTRQFDGGFVYTDTEALESGEAVHAQASDYPAGTLLLKAGTRLGPVEAGILASCGFAEPLCSQLPRIAIFGSGDELVSVSETPEPHQLRQSNTCAVEFAFAAAGFPARTTGKLTDDLSVARPQLELLVESHDVIVLSGAVSKGKLDWIPGALDELSQKHFHGVEQRPGKPMGFWKMDDGPAIFALPGNPVSTLVGAHRYVLPYLQACTGGAANAWPKVALAESFSFEPPMTLYLPFNFNELGQAVPQPTQNSGDYARLSGSAGFIHLPAGKSDWPARAELEYTPW